MRARPLGSQGPSISVIGFGAWEAGGVGWGPPLPDDEVLRAMRAAFDAGIGWVDTAELYGGGRSEELVGKAVQDRDDVGVFTKVAPTGSGVHAAGVRKGAEGSLRRLRRDVIDLYQVHWPHPQVPLEETWEAMAELVEDELVRFVGLSNFGRDQIERCEAIRHVDSLQPHFSMLHRAGREDLFPFCQANGTGVICYGPLAYGLLTGAVTAETRFGPDDWRSGLLGVGYYAELFAPGVLERNLEIVASLRPVADRLGVTLAQLALAWVVHQEGVTGAIAGSRSPRHVVDNAAAGDVELGPEDLEEIEAALKRG
ncbi:MAG: aldo/keto reductase [Actinomycetota bacterium]|nr:aldo/keto reductase [Actinomycetota bacterium]